MRVRKPHRKSRSGCAQCKARRIKCDETKPKCVKCTMRNAPCSFSQGLERTTSFQTNIQDDSARTYNPTVNDPMWYLGQNICERGVVILDFSVPPLHVESWLNPCWSIQNLPFSNIGLIPALQSNSAITSVSMEYSWWSETETILSVSHPSLHDSTILSEDFPSKLENPEISMESLCQLPKDSPTTMLHATWEDFVLFPPSPAVAMKELLLLEPNFDVNLERDSEQDEKLTSRHDITLHTHTSSEHMEETTARTKRCTF
ncbi:hypothetical protein BKA64DRAFT_654994 [Cadophora sp. MPI-SDFR-AT-0126]|nr:hypothetical protein BKA64DRAFT_654994 [Leotiomycetes sp. MPI-SDFR-AT-0126]